MKSFVCNSQYLQWSLVGSRQSTVQQIGGQENVYRMEILLILLHLIPDNSQATGFCAIWSFWTDFESNLNATVVLIQVDQVKCHRYPFVYRGECLAKSRKMPYQFFPGILSAGLG